MPIRRRAKPSEEGYVMLIAIFLMALLVISLGIAAPQVAKSIQRDKDLETYHRGLQYRRAIQLYYKKFNAYPPNVDALVKTNDIRFLRKKYVDPITGKADWKPVLYGQNKVPMAMGFFGQPLAGGATSIAGIGPSGGGAIMPQGIGSIFGGSTPSSTSGSGSTGTSGASSGSGSTNSTIGSTANSTSSTSSGTNSSGSSSSSSGSDQSGQSGGQTFGGAGIVGFSPASPRKSILIYKKKDHYNEWEFTYDPISDQKTITGGNAGNGAGIGQPANGTTPSSTTPTPTTPSTSTGTQ
ncbi:MAG: hypothetical protein P4K93_04505 [Terracidiphilus sp.]|nr:hypothetical protein [Terracidiphilus sp.]MDR3797384.1 hypothetical protein [Terracidiphilus sp.]